MIQLIKADSVWCQEGSSDKVYSVQLIFDSSANRYKVTSQYGRRTATPRSAPDTYEGGNRARAEYEYNRLLSSKINSKKSKYSKIITPPIIPVEYGGSGMSTKSVEEELLTSKGLEALNEFFNLSTTEDTQPEKKFDSADDLIMSVFNV